VAPHVQVSHADAVTETYREAATRTAFHHAAANSYALIMLYPQVVEIPGRGGGVKTKLKTDQWSGYMSEAATKLSP